MRSNMLPEGATFTFERNLFGRLRASTCVSIRYCNAAESIVDVVTNRGGARSMGDKLVSPLSRPVRGRG